jgi:hypothetical protein
MKRFLAAIPAVSFFLITGCGTGTLDLAGYPDAAHDRLYQDGRLGGDKGYASFDLRKAWQSATE